MFSRHGGLELQLIETLEDVELLRETNELECKTAGGRDGKGALPKDFWPTYSAFANTDGGVVLLGIKEKDHAFTVVGIDNPAKVREELFSTLNNREKVSVNLLGDEDVHEYQIDGKTVIAVCIPRASRAQRPVYLNKNPMAGTVYSRLNEGDVRLDQEDVKRMLSEQLNDSRDDKIFEGYTFADLDENTLRAYRQVFSNRTPVHPWNDLDDIEFLKQLGGWRTNRRTGTSGPTGAGLLMFGRMASISEAYPYYMLDYQERPEAKTERRWVDRITLDGTWSGNLYDFYRKVYLKLTSDLKVPFALTEGERQEDTGLHIALREALANALIHADYSDRASVLIVKRPDMYGFRNPGLMRISVEAAKKGGDSDCRNRTLQKMFRFIGAGEQAGTGIPKIFQGWQAQHWKLPNLREAREPFNQTLLELRMIDLFPAGIIKSLREKFGRKFEGLSQDERTALALAASEGTVNHKRLSEISSNHPAEVSRALQQLTQSGLLVQNGTGRGAVYHLDGLDMPSPDDIFGPAPLASSEVVDSVSAPSALEESLLGSVASSKGNGLSSTGNEASSTGNETSSIGKKTSSAGKERPRDKEGYVLADQLKLPILDALHDLSADERERLEKIAALPREKLRVQKEELREVLLNLCSGHYLPLQALAELVNRNPESLRNDYLKVMVREGALTLAFPQTPTHERQAYCTSRTLPAEE